MTDLFNYPTMLDLLNSLKAFGTVEFKEKMQLFPTIKKGIVDAKDQFPVLSLEPENEVIELIGSTQQFIIRRRINFVIFVKGFEKKEMTKKLRKIADLFKTVLKPTADSWMLDSSNLHQVFNLHFEPESIGDPLDFNNQWVYSYSFPIVFSSYYGYPIDKYITSQYYGTDYEDLLNTLFSLSKELNFVKYLRDVQTPTPMDDLPALLIDYAQPEANRDERTSSQDYDAYLDFVIFDALATREITLDKHLENVAKVFNFILKYEDLKGKLELFRVQEINYGVQAFDGQRKPLFATRISTVANFYQSLY